ncbi:iron-containing redox enzyme family protein [Sorangium sp. So ce1036]|uniref:iron-containing redox enzyme family protein n=1 Tax=Sorangium sp. So ce1036 TaxID=3133328 RepID=UPI003F0238D6
MSANLLSLLEHEAEMLIATLDANPAARRLFEGTISAAEYSSFLEQTYQYVRWTRPLCERCGVRLIEAGGGPLASLFLRKAAEESGHEQWALDDLSALGHEPRAARRSALLPATRAYIAWNRCCAETGTPEAFLGTAYVLEALSARRADRTATHLVARSGIPGIEGAVRFLRGHGGADAAHMHELLSELAAVSSVAQRDTIALSARVTRELYPLIVAGTMTRAAPDVVSSRPSRRPEAPRDSESRAGCRPPASAS